MHRNQRSKLLLCMLTTMTGVILMTRQMSGREINPVAILGTNLCASVVVWLAFMFLCLRRKTTWLSFLSYAIRTGLVCMAVTFLAAGALSQPAIGQHRYAEILARDILPTFAGVTAAAAIAYVAVLVILKLFIIHTRRKNKPSS